MSYRAARLIVASALALWSPTEVEAQTVVTPLFPGITHIKRTEQYPPFLCPGCPARKCSSAAFRAFSAACWHVKQHQAQWPPASRSRAAANSPRPCPNQSALRSTEISFGSLYHTARGREDEPIP